MRNLFTHLLALVLLAGLLPQGFSQSPDRFNLQMVIRDPATLAPVTNSRVAVKVKVYEAGRSGSPYYEEIHANLQTGPLGILNLQVGSGGFPTGAFTDIDWRKGNVWFSTYVDPGNGFNFQLVDSTRLLSIPYALYAQETAGEPVGTVKLFWDAGGRLPLPPNWVVLDGRTINDPTSPLDGITLPNMNNRYAVGNNGNGVASTVGNAGHRIDLSHSHTVNSHSHSVADHSHGPGSLRFAVMHVSTPAASRPHIYFWNSGGGLNMAVETVGVDRDGDPDGADIPNGLPSGNYYTGPSNLSSGATANAGGGSTGASSPGTDARLSPGQSIQPESIGFMYIMKIK